MQMPPPSSGPTRMGPETFQAFRSGYDVSIHEKLGSHPVPGTSGRARRFSVWAPRALQVSLVGDFNGWNRSIDPLFPLADTGVWSTVAAGPKAGDRYQYAILCPDQTRVFKSDPCATRFANLPDHSSVVSDRFQFDWNDQDWLQRRASCDWLTTPISIYELHLGSWRNPTIDSSHATSYRSIAQPLVNYLKDSGFTHVLLMPLMEHPFDGSWGYQVTGYFAATHRYGYPRDLASLVDTLHRHGIGVLFDWVPAHFPKDEFGLWRFDGSPVYEYSAVREGEHPDWGTAVFDYNKPQVVSFLISSALYWLREFHFDGIRVDAVASMIYRDYSRPSGDWVPNVKGGRDNLEAIDFLRTLNTEIGERHPGVIRMAEESTAWNGVTAPVEAGGLGFDLQWNLGWMHDSLAYFTTPVPARKRTRSQLTLPALYQESERYCLPFSHDEVVHLKGSMLAKMPGPNHRIQADHLRSLYTWMWAWPGKKLLFMGSEFGQITEWSNATPLQWELLRTPPHAGIQRLIRRLNAFYRDHPTLAATDHDHSTFEWLQGDGGESETFAFMRRSSHPRHTLVCVGHFSDTPLNAMPVGIPSAGPWEICLDSSWTDFQGTHAPLSTTLSARSIPHHHHAFSLSLDLAPRSTLYLCPVASPR